MKYTMSNDKNFNAYFRTNSAVYNFPVKTPQICPVCGMRQGGIFKKGQMFPAGNLDYWFATFECTECTGIYGLVFDVDKHMHTASFKTFHPTVHPTYEDDVLSTCSPQFVALYRQAILAEYHGCLDVAAIGYRAALETLVKDYAVSELGEDASAVNNLTLYKAIGLYLQDGALAAADVVRILGNDYAHLSRQYQDIGFETIKQYMDVLIAQIRVKLLLAHPPVHREEGSPGQK